MTATRLTPESLDECDQWLMSAKEAQNKGDYKKAAIDIERAYRVAPQAPRVWHAGAVLRMRQKDYSWAYETLGMVHQAIPNAADPCYHAGICCMSMGDYQQAKQWLKRATRRYGKHDGAGAWQVLASVYAMLGEESASRNAYQRCVECKPETADDRFNQGLVHLLRGNYAEGWPLYESRLELPGFQPHRVVDLPRWKGHGVDFVLIQSEQGVGDAIQMERYVRHVSGHSGLTPQVSVARELVSWFRSRGHDAVATGDPINPAVEAWVPVMSLPDIFGVVPPSPPTWKRQPPRVFVSDPYYVKSAPRVGICWAGNRDHPNDKDRSMPPEYLAGFANIPCDLVNLTVGWPLGGTSSGIQTFRPESFLATAELMETLDAVVSVDTAVLHLAATLGVPTIGLVPTAPEWRWRESGETSDWYPSLQIVRRKRSDAWPQAIEEAGERLKAML